ncbi:MAG: DUF5063 domain-containing protein, partial [Bacteroidota bacterium]
STHGKLTAQHNKGTLQNQNCLIVDLDLNEWFEKSIDEKEFEYVKNRTGELLGTSQYYLTIFDPTENIFGDEAPVIGDLLDDILDIYKDIKRQLLVFDLNTEASIESAIWGMKFDFWHHWSAHAIDALRTIHYVLEKTEKYK